MRYFIYSEKHRSYYDYCNELNEVLWGENEMYATKFDSREEAQKVIDYDLEPSNDSYTIKEFSEIMEFVLIKEVDGKRYYVDFIDKGVLFAEDKSEALKFIFTPERDFNEIADVIKVAKKWGCEVLLLS